MADVEFGVVDAMDCIVQLPRPILITVITHSYRAIGRAAY